MRIEIQAWMFLLAPVVVGYFLAGVVLWYGWKTGEFHLGRHRWEPIPISSRQGQLLRESGFTRYCAHPGCRRID